jgi:NAD+ kinase
MRTFERISLVLHESRRAAQEVANQVVESAAARGLEVLGNEGPPAAGTDLIIGIGGDGTLLTAAAFALAGGVPVVGINLGNVGYLAEVEPDDIDHMLDALVSGTLEVHERMTVKAELEDGRVWQGINDVVLEKVMSQRLIQLGVHINGQFFTTYRSDGIIVATPLGSTAYSLSAGGPVLDPRLGALILTPVAPHSLLARSMVLAPDATVMCRVELDRQVRLNVDGRAATVLDPGAEVTITRGPESIEFLSLAHRPFPQMVRYQFGLDHA